MPAGSQRGFTLLAVIAATLLLALGTQGVVRVLSEQARRDREDELLRVGREFALALRSYHDRSPGSAKAFPTSLDELAEDRRFLGVQRHIRRVHADPVTGGAPWGLVRDAGGGIRGIHSTSTDAPIRSAGADLGDYLLGPAARYADWQFVYTPAATVDTPAAPTPESH